MPLNASEEISPPASSFNEATWFNL